MNTKVFSKNYLLPEEIEQLESVIYLRQNSKALKLKVSYNLLIETKDEKRGIEIAQRLQVAFQKNECGFKFVKVMTEEELTLTDIRSLHKDTLLIIHDVHTNGEKHISAFQDTPSIMKIMIVSSKPESNFFFDQIMNKHISIQNMDGNMLYEAFKDMIQKEGIPVSKTFLIRMKYYIQCTYKNSPLKNLNYIDFLKNKMYQEVFSRPIEVLKSQSKSKKDTSVVQEILDEMDLNIQSKETLDILDQINDLEGLPSVKQFINNMDQILTFDTIHETETPMMFHKVFIGEEYIGKKYVTDLYTRYLYSLHMVTDKKYVTYDGEELESFIQENQGKVLLVREEYITRGQEIIELVDSMEQRSVVVFHTKRKGDYAFGQAVPFEEVNWIENFKKMVKAANYSYTEQALEKVDNTIRTYQFNNQFENWLTVQSIFEEMTTNCSLQEENPVLEDFHLTRVVEKKETLTGPYSQNFKSNSKKRKKK